MNLRRRCDFMATVCRC